MTRIALTTAAFFLAMGTAFAGSDHYGADNANQQTASVDHQPTASIRRHAVAKSADVDVTMPAGPSASKAWPDPGQGIWGN